MFFNQDSTCVLKAKLTDAVATSQLKISVTYRDNTDNYHQDAIVSTNGAIAVTLLAAPVGSVVNIVELIKIYNPDTEANTVQILANDDVIYTCTVGANQSVTLSEGGINTGIGSNSTQLEEELAVKADKGGDSTQAFEVADATTATQAVNKGQLDALVSGINTDIDALEAEIVAKVDQAYVDTNLALKANSEDVTTSLATKANLNGDSTQTFNVADATTATQAVNKGQLDSYMPNRQLVSSQSMPSNNAFEVMLPTTASTFLTGSTFTAPANGYFSIAAISTSLSGYIYMLNGHLSTQGCGTTAMGVNVYLPCKAGQSIFYGWNSLVADNIHAWFTYAEGEV